MFYLNFHSTSFTESVNSTDLRINQCSTELHNDDHNTELQNQMTQDILIEQHNLSPSENGFEY